MVDPWNQTGFAQQDRDQTMMVLQGESEGKRFTSSRNYTHVGAQGSRPGFHPVRLLHEFVGSKANEHDEHIANVPQCYSLQKMYKARLAFKKEQNSHLSIVNVIRKSCLHNDRNERNEER